MICPHCLSNQTEVYNSRPTKKLGQMWRRRRCLVCKREFTTYETVDLEKILKVLNNTKKITGFSRAKLQLDILRVTEHRKDDAAYWLAQSVEQQLMRLGATTDGHITTTQIREVCETILKHFDTVAFVKYLATHSPTLLDVKNLKQQPR